MRGERRVRVQYVNYWIKAARRAAFLCSVYMCVIFGIGEDVGNKKEEGS